MKNNKKIVYIVGAVAIVIVAGIAIFAGSGEQFQGYLAQEKDSSLEEVTTEKGYLEGQEDQTDYSSVTNYDYSDSERRILRVEDATTIERTTPDVDVKEDTSTDSSPTYTEAERIPTILTEEQETTTTEDPVTEPEYTVTEDPVTEPEYTVTAVDVTYLDKDLSLTDTTVYITTTGTFEDKDFIKIDDEIMRVDDVISEAAGDDLIVSRGRKGTAAVAHSSGDPYNMEDNGFGTTLVDFD
jgi:hypothetical protein